MGGGVEVSDSVSEPHRVPREGHPKPDKNPLEGPSDVITLYTVLGGGG